MGQEIREIKEENKAREQAREENKAREQAREQEMREM